MKNTLPTILAGSLLLSIATTAFAGATIEIRLQNGSRWQGELQERIELTYRQRGVEIKTTATLLRTADYYITMPAAYHGSRCFSARRASGESSVFSTSRRW